VAANSWRREEEEGFELSSPPPLMEVGARRLRSWKRGGAAIWVLGCGGAASNGRGRRREG